MSLFLPLFETFFFQEILKAKTKPAYAGSQIPQLAGML
jgi:hypothetical protein